MRRPAPRSATSTPTDGPISWSASPAAPVVSSLPGPGKQQLAVGSLIHEPRPDLVYTGNQGETLVRTIEVDGDIVAPSVSQFGIGYVRGFVLADLNEDGWSDFVSVGVAAPSTLSVRVSL